MIEGRKVVVVMPAYNAEKTLKKTVIELPDSVDDVIIVDDNSHDNTEKVARKLKLKYFKHNKNLGYGGNQKTCYKTAMRLKPDIVIMVHPDYQYSPRLVTAMASMIISGHYDIVLASRIIGDQSSRKLNMPPWRYVSNRFLTLIQNLLLHYKLSEYHTGYRAYSKKALNTLDINSYSDNFIFDNQILVDAIAHKFAIGEISCPTRYEAESSSISLSQSIRYGIEVLQVSLRYRLWKWNLVERVIKPQPKTSFP